MEYYIVLDGMGFPPRRHGALAWLWFFPFYATLTTAKLSLSTGYCVSFFFFYRNCRHLADSVGRERPGLTFQQENDSRKQATVYGVVCLSIRD